MPKLALWYIRVPRILATLRATNSPPFYDRAAIETLFHVSRRHAIRLLGMAGGYEIGNAFLVERAALIVFLEGVESSGAAPEARARRQRVSVALGASSARVPIAIHPRQEGLPAAVVRSEGKIQISYHSAEDLLARIAELVTLATNDFASFKKAMES